MPDDRRENKQARTIAIIQAGLNYKIAYEALADAINHYALIHEQAIKAQDSLMLGKAFAQLITDGASPPPNALKDSILLITEYEHFRKHGKDNARRAINQQYASLVRRGLATPPSRPKKQTRYHFSPMPATPLLEPDPDPYPVPENSPSFESFKRREQGDPGADIVKAENPGDKFLRMVGLMDRPTSQPPQLTPAPNPPTHTFDHQNTDKPLESQEEKPE